MKRALLPRLLALVAIIIIGSYYIFNDILQIHLGSQTYAVTVEMARAGGVYPDAEVTYNGVNVGKVTSIKVSTTGVAVVLAVSNSAHIPADAGAHVRELSALGEQYIDLVPTDPNGPDLTNGSIIPPSRTTVPVAIGTTLADLNGLLGSVNQTDVTTVEDFLTAGLDGTGNDLATIISTGQSLAGALEAAQPQTANLINDGYPVLQTALATRSELTATAANLEQLTQQLASSDSDIDALLQHGDAAATPLAQLVANTTTSIKGTVSDLSTAAFVTQQDAPQTAALFELLPTVVADLDTTVSGGSIHGGLGINGVDTVCPYVPATDLPGPTQVVPDSGNGSFSLDNNCPIAAPDLLQRGADRAPVAGP